MQDPAQFWNERYAKDTYAYGKTPNTFFVEELDQIPPGGILFPAAGEGRNAVYAIEKGWKVIAFDQSEKAKVKAQQLAEERGVNLEYAVSDANDYLCPTMVDAIFYSYFHVPAADRDHLFNKINGFLTNNGMVLFEGFSLKNLDLSSGGPKAPAMLFTEEMVRDLFKDFSSVEVWEEEVVLNEGLYHNGPAVLIRARCRK